MIMDSFGPPMEMDFRVTPMSDLPNDTWYDQDKGHREYPRAWQAVQDSSFYPIDRIVSRLEPAHYRVLFDGSRNVPFFTRIQPVSDEIIGNELLDGLMADVRTFWDSKPRYNTMKLLWRRNILLYGPPGTGKTSINSAIQKLVLERDGIVLHYTDFCFPGIGGVLQYLRAIEPERIVLVCIEDLDSAMTRNPQSEPDLLQFLDGAYRVENVITVATTNFPERLGKRMLRPGRFDLRIHVPPPDDASKTLYLRAFDAEYFTDEMARKWIEATPRFTFADLKELVIQVLISRLPFEQAVDYVKDLAKVPDSADDQPAIGSYV